MNVITISDDELTRLVHDAVEIKAIGIARYVTGKSLADIINQ